jgi:two-component system, LytTR family, response regulator LytT
LTTAIEIPMHDSDTNGLLLVDTDWVERSRLKRELEASGWQVWVAGDATSAIRIIAERPHAISAALVDLQLPGFQGRRVMASLEELDPPPICVAMSIGLNPLAVEAFRHLSNAPLLVKPVHPAQFEAAFREGSSAVENRIARELASASSRH